MRNVLVALMVSVAILATLPDGARAQGPSISVETARPFAMRALAGRGRVLFSVKFLCGTIAPAAGLPLAPGAYTTTIDVHNIVENEIRVALSVNGLLIRDLAIAAGQRQAFDCRILTTGAFVPSTPFSEGFAQIVVSLPSVIDAATAPGPNVVAVYTVAR